MNRYVCELHDRVSSYLLAHQEYFSYYTCYTDLERPQNIIVVFQYVSSKFFLDMDGLGVFCTVFSKCDEIGSLHAVDVWVSFKGVAFE